MALICSIWLIQAFHPDLLDISYRPANLVPAHICRAYLCAPTAYPASTRARLVERSGLPDHPNRIDLCQSGSQIYNMFKPDLAVFVLR